MRAAGSGGLRGQVAGAASAGGGVPRVRVVHSPNHRRSPHHRGLPPLLVPWDVEYFLPWLHRGSSYKGIVRASEIRVTCALCPFSTHQPCAGSAGPGVCPGADAMPTSQRAMPPEPARGRTPRSRPHSPPPPPPPIAELRSDHRQHADSPSRHQRQHRPRRRRRRRRRRRARRSHGKGRRIGSLTVICRVQRSTRHDQEGSVRQCRSLCVAYHRRLRAAPLPQPLGGPGDRTRSGEAVVPPGRAADASLLLFASLRE